MDLMSVGQSECEVKQAKSPDLLDGLKRRRLDAENRLTDLTNAIEALEKNPEIGKVLELVARVR